MLTWYDMPIWLWIVWLVVAFIIGFAITYVAITKKKKEKK
jgi:uncharacterized protein YneF (UPF0154 family)